MFSNSLFTVNDGWYDRDCTICLEIIILLIFNSQQGPLSSSNRLCCNQNPRYSFQFVEKTVLVSQSEKAENEDVAEEEIGDDRKVVKGGLIVDFLSQKPIRMSFSVESKQAPIHVDVPNVRVCSGNHMNPNVDPKGKT